MQVRIWGARGSIACPGPETVRYGGNTSCVQVTLSDGSHLVLDAGTGIRNLGTLLDVPGGHIHVLLTHLHLDHIQGLLFFAPLFNRHEHVTIWGPSAPGGSLQDRISRYLSAPLTPVEVRELPCELDFLDCPTSEWHIGPARIHAAAVNHRGPTLGFRISDGDASLCYIPDHEPALAGAIDEIEPAWISGYSLAAGADLLIHDCQYSDEQYPAHVGWGHSAMSHAIDFAQRTGARRTLLFHHDPYHSDDQLDALLARAEERWQSRGGSAGAIGIAAEGDRIELVPAPAA
jgi:phosphoribosyl 1,2-cyclic phosphodiesterase